MKRLLCGLKHNNLEHHRLLILKYEEKNYQEVMTTAPKNYHYSIIKIIKIATFFVLMTTIWWNVKSGEIIKNITFFELPDQKMYVLIGPKYILQTKED